MSLIQLIVGNETAENVWIFK